MVLLLDLGLLFAAFISANIALAWGEVGSYPFQGDKSGLAGLGGVVLFMLMRWGILAVVLAAGVARGGFAELPGGRAAQAALVLGAHAALGFVSYRGFEWITAAIQSSTPGPLRFAALFAFLIPIPAFFAAFWGLHRAWMPKHLVFSGVLMVLLVWGHVAGWRAGYRR